MHEGAGRYATDIASRSRFTVAATWNGGGIVVVPGGGTIPSVGTFPNLSATDYSVELLVESLTGWAENNGGLWSKITGSSPFNFNGIGTGMRYRANGVIQAARSDGTGAPTYLTTGAGMLRSRGINHVVMTFQRTTQTLAAYTNGRLIGSAVVDGDYADTFGTWIGFCGDANAACRFHKFSLYLRSLPSDEVRWLAAEPYAMIRHAGPPRRYFTVTGLRQRFAASELGPRYAMTPAGPRFRLQGLGPRYAMTERRP
jgi:hypothetical protein